MKNKEETIARRKTLKRAAAAKLKVSIDDLHWINGRLCQVVKTHNRFPSTHAVFHQPVDGVPVVSKPAKAVANRPAWSY